MSKARTGTGTVSAHITTNPRRVSPANSLTLQNHGLAHDASLRASPGSARSNPSGKFSSPRQNSSGGSHETGQSDPKKWFDRSNQNPTATFDTNVMDVDPPFFLKSSESSLEDWQVFKNLAVPPRLRQHETQSSSADDYRSVIDDLTVEIQKLKEQLKHYKQRGPEPLRKDQLFEIKFHGLPKRKKRELEATLREFAANLEDQSPTASSSQQNKSSNDKIHSASNSKHAFSSSGSNVRQVDSAYASMSTGPNSSGVFLGRHASSHGIRSSEQKVESYLRDIPEGLYPKHVAMTDKDRKKLVVRRLEHLFTGKITSRLARRQLPLHIMSHNPSSAASLAPPPISSFGAEVAQPGPAGSTPMQQSTGKSEPTREARILPPDSSRNKSRSRDNGSASNSNGDQTESMGNSNGGGNGGSPPEQRPTRPKDLDPDRAQVPADNMEYIRHLGLVPPELLPNATRETPDVSPDAEGWVYLNLLCNLAQLHMINVTSAFVRAAVSEISTKFQLSPDGRKIRWRGGSEGTRLTSDSSADSSQKSESIIGGGSREIKKCKRKRQKTGRSTGGSGLSSKDHSKFDTYVPSSSDSFHYKPLFVRQDSIGVTSLDDALSSFGPGEDNNVGESRYNLSSSGSWNRKKRRRDGAVIYYSGAPFCTDLSGDLGDTSPATYMMSSGQDAMENSTQHKRPLFRSPSGSNLGIRPLSNPMPLAASDASMEVDDENPPGFTTDSGDETCDADMQVFWSNEPQYLEVHPLEPCGLGGVLPDDHFMIVVTTKRAKEDALKGIDKHDQGTWAETTDGIISRLATMSTSSPAPAPAPTSAQAHVAWRSSSPGVEIEYTSGRIKRLAPVPLPPPVIFFPPFSSDDSYEYEDISDSEHLSIADDSPGLASRGGMPQSNDYPDGVDLSSGDEEGDDPDDVSGAERMYDGGEGDDIAEVRPLDRAARHSIGSSVAAAGTPRDGRKSTSSSDDED